MKALITVLRRTRTFWISIFNVAGLACSLAGLLLLFYFALPNRVPGEPGRLLAENGSPGWEKQQRRYNTYAHWGLALAVVGTILEAVPPVCTALGSVRHRRRYTLDHLMKSSFLPGWPKPPPLLPEVLQELELHGVDSMRGLLASSTDGYSGVGRNTPIKFGNAVAKRGEIQEWLKWKAAVEALWIKLGVVAAMLAAVFSFLALVK